MIHKTIDMVFKTVMMTLLLCSFLFINDSTQLSQSFGSFQLQEICYIVRDAETQWIVFLCLGFYFFTLIVFRALVDIGLDQRCKGAKAHRWLMGLLLINAIFYASHYVPSTSALVLLAGAVIGQGVSMLKSGGRNVDGGNGIVAMLVSLFVVLLSFISIWNGDVDHLYQYHNNLRWTGTWDNPNIAGLLMGTGGILAAGLMAALYERYYNNTYNLLLSDGRRSPLQLWNLFCAICFLIAAICMGRGLLHSYSRGAWIATDCGATYLLWHWLNSETRQVCEGDLFYSCRRDESYLSKLEIGNWKSGTNRTSSRRSLQLVEAIWFLRISFVSLLKRNWFPFLVVLISAVALICWHFGQTDWHPARRALSVVNTADFSSRNRVAAWVGDLQIMAEHPWFGAGWNQPEPLYEHYYLSPKLTESAAIQMNDYLMLGATLGLSALFCFAMYLWLSLTGKGEGGTRKADWLQTTCHAGAIVLLVGFWFDGGLFKLPTAATFWILFELGSMQPRMDTNKHQCEPQKNTENADQ